MGVTIQIWTLGLGDRQEDVAAAVREGLKEASPGAEVEVEDLLSYVRPFLRAAVRDGYHALLDWLPGVWGFLYDSEALMARVMPLQQLSKLYDFEALQASLRRASPGVVLALHPLALLPATLLKQQGDLRAPVVGLNMAFHVHLSWIQPGVSRYILAHAGLEDALRQQQVLAEKLRSPGIPLGSRFAQVPVRGDARSHLGLMESPDAPVFLWMADAFSPAEIRRILLQMALCPREIQWLVYYGDDADKAELLREGAQEAGIRAKMFGRVRDLRDFVGASDLVFCHGEALLLAEILACGVPPVMIAPGRGAPQRDAAFLREQGVGVIIERTNVFASAVEGLMRMGALAQLQERCQDFHPGDASREVATLLIDLHQRREEVLQRDAEILEEEARLLEAASKGAVAPILDPTRLLVAHGADLAASESSLPAVQGPFEEIGVDKAGPLQLRVGDWKSRYTALRVREKKLEEALDAATEKTKRWKHRFALAEQADDASLIEEAARHVQTAQDELARLRSSWRELQEEKDFLQKQKQSPAQQPQVQNQPQSETKEEDAESRFQALEMDDELRRLKRRLRVEKADLEQLKDEEW